jgi:hypothetical protein
MLVPESESSKLGRTFGKERLGGLEEPQLAFRRRYGVELAVRVKPICRIVRVEDRAEQGRDVRFLPHLSRGFVSGGALERSTKLTREGEWEKNETNRSPRTSIAYVFTPPGILTSTRMSTLENALKQLHQTRQRRSSAQNGKGDRDSTHQ